MERIILRAKNGFLFTDGEVYGKTVYLGVNDKPENWHEISKEEYEKRVKEEEAID